MSINATLDKIAEEAAELSAAATKLARIRRGTSLKRSERKQKEQVADELLDLRTALGKLPPNYLPLVVSR